MRYFTNACFPRSRVVVCDRGSGWVATANSHRASGYLDPCPRPGRVVRCVSVSCCMSCWCWCCVTLSEDGKLYNTIHAEYSHESSPSCSGDGGRPLSAVGSTPPCVGLGCTGCGRCGRPLTRACRECCADGSRGRDGLALAEAYAPPLAPLRTRSGVSAFERGGRHVATEAGRFASSAAAPVGCDELTRAVRLRRSISGRARRADVGSAGGDG